MRITILGTRGEIEQTAPYHSRHSGILIDGALMVDLGEREFLDLAPQAVLITHLHPDHAYFVRAGEERPPAGVPIFAPEGYKDYGVTVLDAPRTIAGYSANRSYPATASRSAPKPTSSPKARRRSSTRVTWSGSTRTITLFSKDSTW